METQQRFIGTVVGYMLKVMKARKNEIKFKKEFSCIRHGNFPEFISLIKEPVQDMVVWRGEIEVNPQPKEDD